MYDTKTYTGNGSFQKRLVANPSIVDSNPKSVLKQLRRNEV